MKLYITLFFLLFSFPAFSNWNDCIIGNYEYKDSFNQSTFLDLNKDL
jgi:hypothetical protein